MEVDHEDIGGENQSLWKSFLSKATKLTYKHGEATMIVCGDKGNPYGEIIHSMRSSSSRIGRPVDQKPYFFNYRFVDADGEIDEALDLHTWTVQDENHFDQVPTVVCHSHLVNGRLGYMFCIDISNPNMIKVQFDKWVDFINKSQQLVFEKVGDKKAQQLRDAVSRRIQLFELSGVEENLLVEDEKETPELDREKPKINVGAQITVVICQAEQFEKNFAHVKAGTDRLFQRILLYIRERSLEIGATLFTFANRRQGANIKRYIDSVVMEQKLTKKPNITDIALQELKDEQVFLPAGFDSEAKLATKRSKHRKSFEELFPTKPTKKPRKRYEYKKEPQRDDQHYLGILFFELKKTESAREARAKWEKSQEKGKTPVDRRMRVPNVHRRSSRRSVGGRKDYKIRNDKYKTLRLIKGKDRQPSNSKLN